MRETKKTPQAQKITKKSRLKRFIFLAIQVATLLLLWLLLSGRYQVKYISLGVASAILVTYLTKDLFFSFLYEGQDRVTRIRQVFAESWRLLLYIPWLIYKIIQANIQVAAVVINPRLPINPQVFKFRTQMKRTIARVTLANSITLTPGTVTIQLEDGEYIIHALMPESAGDIVEASMQNKIARIYGEEAEPKPDVKWAYSFKELEP